MFGVFNLLFHCWEETGVCGSRDMVVWLLPAIPFELLYKIHVSYSFILKLYTNLWLTIYEQPMKNNFKIV